MRFVRNKDAVEDDLTSIPKRFSIVEYAPTLYDVGACNGYVNLAGAINLTNFAQ